MVHKGEKSLVRLAGDVRRVLKMIVRSQGEKSW